MQINWQNISEKIYSILKGSTKSVTMYDAKGNNTLDPADATRFFAKLKSFDRKLDDIIILVACHTEGGDNHIDLKTPNLKNTRDFEQIHNLRNHLKNSVGAREGLKINWLVFDHAINPKEEAVNNIKESKDVSKVYGTTKSSFQQIGEAKLIIRHSAAVNENVHGARGRQIRALFVENKLGERFAYPHLHVSGARAFARHISNGGTNHDAVANKLYALSEDYMKLRRSTNSLRMNESANSVWVERLQESMNEINRTLKSMHGPKGYKKVSVQMLEETANEINEDQIQALRDEIAECCGCQADSPGYQDLNTAAKYIILKGPIESPVNFSWRMRPDITSRAAEFPTVAERLNWQLSELAAACSNDQAIGKLQSIAEQISNGIMPSESDLNIIRRAYESSQKYISEDSVIPEENELNEFIDSFSEENIFAEEITDEGNEFSGALAAAKAKGEKSFSVDGKKYHVKEDGTVEEDVDETRMPASVIKNKQRLAHMSDKEFAEKYNDRSDDELKSMAWRHGYGKDSPYYVTKRKRGQEDVATEGAIGGLVGGAAGKALGAEFGPVGSAVGGTVGSAVGSKVGDLIAGDDHDNLAECNMTMEGEHCPVHGMKECMAAENTPDMYEQGITDDTNNDVAETIQEIEDGLYESQITRLKNLAGLK